MVEQQAKQHKLFHESKNLYHVHLENSNFTVTFIFVKGYIGILLPSSINISDVPDQ